MDTNTVGLNLDFFDGIRKTQVKLASGMNIALVEITLEPDGAMEYE